VALRHAAETSRARRTGASVRERSGSGGLEDRNAANYTSLAGSWLRESNPFGASYQDAPRPTATSVRWSHWVTLPVVLLARRNSSLLRLTPGRACKESNLVERIWNPRCDLRSDPQRLVWVSIPSPPLDRRMSTPADSRGIDVSLLGACGATCSAQCTDEAGLTSRDLRALGASRTRFASA